MNQCEYCVSRSNEERWKPGPFQVAKNVLDIPSALDWIAQYRPGAALHLSGGEPLLRPDIADVVRQCLAAGHDVTLFTNGQLLPDRAALWEAPIAWVVTWHQDAVSLTHFLHCLNFIRNRQRLHVHSILYRDEHEQRMHEMAAHFNDVYDFRFRFADQTARTWGLWSLTDRVIDKPASQYLTLIEEDGAIYPCNTKYWGPIGSIYNPNHTDQAKAEALDEHAAACFAAHKCGAHLTARALEANPCR